MSVIVAVKENGVVYMGADSQTTVGNRWKRHCLNETGYKIHRFENGILLGSCGAVQTTQLLLSNPDIFTLDENGTLTKRWIVTKIVPEIQKLLGREKLLNEDGGMENSLVLAHGDKAYALHSYFRVLAKSDFFAIGAGRSSALYALTEQDGKTVRERLFKAMEMSTELVDSISSPYVFIDTKNLQFELVQGEKR